MADPVTLGLLAVGTAMSAMSAIGGANAQAAQYQAQANAQNYNAQLQQQQGEQAGAMAAAQANQAGNRAEAALARQRAATAQSRIGFQGTGGDLIDQSAANAELDRQNILYEGYLNQQGLFAQAEQSTYAANAAQSQIGPATTAGYMGAGASVLSGASQYRYMGQQSALDARLRKAGF